MSNFTCLFCSCSGLYDPCGAVACGLHYTQAGNPDEVANLKASIATLRAKGAIVKLSYGGQQYGNIAANTEYNVGVS